MGFYRLENVIPIVGNKPSHCHQNITQKGDTGLAATALTRKMQYLPYLAMNSGETIANALKMLIIQMLPVNA